MPLAFSGKGVRIPTTMTTDWDGTISGVAIKGDRIYFWKAKATYQGYTIQVCSEKDSDYSRIEGNGFDLLREVECVVSLISMKS